tara:strand:+ start:1480 stop:1824 length:345 start_codon:yes stop_codon:yes gene_type:complete
MARLDQRIQANISLAIHKNHQQYMPFFLMNNKRIRLCGISRNEMIVEVSFLQLDKDNSFVPANKVYNCKKKAQRNQFKKLLLDIFTSLNRTDHVYIDESELFARLGYLAAGISR